MAVSREDVRRYLDGHRVASARLREETLRRLPLLTVEAARREYDSLWQVWITTQALGERSALDHRAIEDRLALRRRLDALARRERPV